MESEDMYSVYVLKSEKNGKNYIGYTSKSPEQRLKEHNQGLSQYTSHNRPYKLVYSESHDNADLAQKRERFFKTGSGRRVLSKILNAPIAQMDRVRPS